jgi:hypothetical protein
MFPPLVDILSVPELELTLSVEQVFIVAVPELDKLITFDTPFDTFKLLIN